MATLARLYTDEDMSSLVATLLRARGLDITTVPEEGTFGSTDKVQLELAITLERCLITHN
jgi:predicted nuclease of predicted toxin-antitoxin system